ncbi:hypothetical protein BC833DRAFT_570156 [Globomyces pollinis-pini]|nr:hypothetical protein BC833DRAFT_570156 [Globomyces pollinis-pini]
MPETAQVWSFLSNTVDQSPEASSSGSFPVHLNSYLFVTGESEFLNSQKSADSIKSIGISSNEKRSPYNSGSLDYRNSKSIEEYELENIELRRNLDVMTRRVQELELAQQENTMLRSSIIQFHQDVQKKRTAGPMIVRAPNGSQISNSLKFKKQTMINSAKFEQIKGNERGTNDLSNVQSGSREISTDGKVANDSTLLERIKYLETELERVNGLYNGLLQKWERLKESARKKKESKTAIYSDLESSLYIGHDNSILDSVGGIENKTENKNNIANSIYHAAESKGHETDEEVISPMGQSMGQSLYYSIGSKQ